MSAGLSVLQLSSGRSPEAFYKYCAVHLGTALTASVHPLPHSEGREAHPHPCSAVRLSSLACFVSSRGRARLQPVEDTTLKMKALLLLRYLLLILPASTLLLDLALYTYFFFFKDLT